jgi:hypothetical protein
MEMFAASPAPHLRAGLDPTRAAAILQALCLPEVFDQLVCHSGWLVEEYQAWLARALKHALLEEIVRTERDV